VSQEPERVEDPAAEALREAAGEPIPVESSRSERGPERENFVVAWARAIGLGLRDTAQDVLDEGRRGARDKRAQMWEKFDQKTRSRRARER
jgi:hypothetical protein